MQLSDLAVEDQNSFNLIRQGGKMRDQGVTFFNRIAVKPYTKRI
jgi:guanyl-specific ribonuclease Sa